jgi:hypothetical protein
MRAAIFDAFDQNVKELAAHDCERHPVTDEEASDNRCDFVDAVTARILALQCEPHGMDAGLREDALESQEFYELMQAYRHASLTNQNAAVAAFEAVKSFVRARNVSETVSSAAAIRRDPEAQEGEQRK